MDNGLTPRQQLVKWTLFFIALTFCAGKYYLGTLPEKREHIHVFEPVSERTIASAGTYRVRYYTRCVLCDFVRPGQEIEFDKRGHAVSYSIYLPPVEKWMKNQQPVERRYQRWVSTYSVVSR